MTVAGYTHAGWLATQGSHIKPAEGDERALAAIRQAVRDHYQAADVSDDAPVFFWLGAHVKGHGSTLYDVPPDASLRYFKRREFPQLPIATWPEDDGDTRRDDLLQRSAPAEGDPEGIREVMTRTRLYHEVPEAVFPNETGELRWFANGLHVVGPGDDPSVFQTPMSRVEELIIPRQAPTLPWIKAPALVR